MEQDLKQAVRILYKRLGFTVVAVITLAVGIGANSAIFSVVNAVVLRPLPYADPERLVGVFPEKWFSKEEYSFFAGQVKSFANLAAFSGAGGGFTLTGDGTPEMLDGMSVGASFFPTLGIKPVLGRTFLPEEEQPGRGNVVLLSHELWQRRFAADPQILGKTLLVDGRSVRVIGVLPPRFRFLPIDAALWLPLTFDPSDAEDYHGTYLLAVGRLADGVTPDKAQSEVRLAAARMRERFSLPEDFGADASVVPLLDQMVGNMRPVFWTLLGAVGFILLIACANVANLALAQAVNRRREIAVRIALGASYRRLVRQILTENVVLALVGGGLGLLLAFWAVRVLVALLPEGMPRTHEIGVDLPVLVFTFAISIATGFLFGLAPVLQARKTDLQETLKEGSASTAGGVRGGRLHGALVVAEMALALVLLIWAGLLVKSFWRLQHVEIGFDPENMLTLRLVLPDSRYAEAAQREVFYQQTLEKLAALPEVESAGAIHFLPMTGSGWRGGLTIEDRPAPGETPPVVNWRVVTPGYFKTLGLRPAAGRLFDASDRAGAPPAAVINEAMARQLFPGESPLGKRIRNRIEGGEEWATVVGIVGDSRYESLGVEPAPVMYRPYGQVGRNLTMSLLLRTRSDPMRVARAASQEIWEVDKGVPVFKVRSMEQVLYESAAQPRVIMSLLAGFAGVALLLGVIGVYGVMSYAVRNKVHEIGIRMALGARRGQIVRWTLRRSFLLALLGVVLGLAAALWTTRLMASLLFEVSSRDPLTFTLIPLLLLAGALAGSYLPSLRASRVSPTVALKAD